MIWKVDLFGVDSKEVSSCGIRLKNWRSNSINRSKNFQFSIRGKKKQILESHNETNERIKWCLGDAIKSCASSVGR